MPLVNPLDAFFFLLGGGDFDDRCGNLCDERVLLIFVANGAPLSLYLPLSFPPHTARQAALTMNQSLRGFFDGRWGEEVTWLHSFHSLSACPYALSIIH